MDSSGVLNAFKNEGEYSDSAARFRDLNTDSSVDSIFYAALLGPLTYGVARQGLEFSKVTSAVLAAGVGAAVYWQFWRMAVGAFAPLTYGYSTVTRHSSTVGKGL